jgi:hypothetical protein
MFKTLSNFAGVYRAVMQPATNDKTTAINAPARATIKPAVEVKSPNFAAKGNMPTVIKDATSTTRIGGGPEPDSFLAKMAMGLILSCPDHP